MLTAVGSFVDSYNTLFLVDHQTSLEGYVDLLSHCFLACLLTLRSQFVNFTTQYLRHIDVSHPSGLALVVDFEDPSSHIGVTVDQVGEFIEQAELAVNVSTVRQNRQNFRLAFSDSLLEGFAAAPSL